MSGLARTRPPESIQISTDSWTEPYWQAAKEGRLVAPRCGSCGAFRMPPTPFCPSCQSQQVDWVTLSGRASVFSYTVVHGLPGQPDLTLVPVVVEFPDAPGIHLVSNVVDAEPSAVDVGTPLEVAFVDIADGWRLPVFRVAPA